MSIALKLLAPRIVVATMLVLALLSGLAPFSASSLSLSHPCKMACCAGKPPHEAGSCASVIACHANLPAHKKSPQLDAEGLGETSPVSRTHQHAMMSMTDVPTVDASSSGHLQGTGHYDPAQPAASQNASRQESGVAATAFSSPCPSDCGAGLFSSSSQCRPRNPAGLSSAEQPRPPSCAHLFLSERNLAKTLSVLRGQRIPRAPPVLFS